MDADDDTVDRIIEAAIAHISADPLHPDDPPPEWKRVIPVLRRAFAMAALIREVQTTPSLIPPSREWARKADAILEYIGPG